MTTREIDTAALLYTRADRFHPCAVPTLVSTTRNDEVLAAARRTNCPAAVLHRALPLAAEKGKNKAGRSRTSTSLCADAAPAFRR